MTLMTIRTRAGITLLVGLLSGALYGQTPGASQASADPNVMCIERMELPSYPLLGQQARISGTIIVDVVVSATGSVQDMNIQADLKLPDNQKRVLAQPAAESVRGAAFTDSCGGKTVRVVFVFELAGTSTSRPKQTFAFGPPNRFWIRSEAPHFQP